jgi:predicted O-methyltransferase YrrM
MEYKDIIQKLGGIDGFMGSELQREYMFNLGVQSFCAAEIGTWKGLSAAIVGLGMSERKMRGKYYCVDTFESSNNELEKENTLDIFLQHIINFNLSDILIPIKGFSYDINVWKLIPHGLDFIYIDGSHETPAVIQDTLLYLHKVRNGGLILYHDYTWQTVREAIDHLIQIKLIRLVEFFDDFAVCTPVHHV